jgi:hypothetical protein
MSTHEEWIASRNKNWSNPTGFLAVTGMHWLSEVPQTFDDVTGVWWATGHTVHATGFDGVAEEQTWTLEPRAEIMVPMAGGKLEIASRGGNMVLRPRHSDNEMLRLFDGIDAFEYDPALKVEATLIPDEHAVPVSSVIGDLGIAYESAGELVFEINGEKASLVGFKRPDPEVLWLIFRDATSGHETYGTGRSVSAKHIEGDHWEIDFNQSANFPCAYTDFATCPLAPRENHMTVAIRAGEKAPKIKRTADGVVKK